MALSRSFFTLSLVVALAGDPYVLTVHLPEGFRLQGAQVSGENVEFANQTDAATVRMVPSATKTVEWKMKFATSD